MTNTNTETKLINVLYDLADFDPSSLDRLDFSTAKFISLGLRHEIDAINRMHPVIEERIAHNKELNDLFSFNVDGQIMLFRKVIENQLNYLSSKAVETHKALKSILTLTSGEVNV